MASLTALKLSPEEEKTLHWEGIVAVCTGKYNNLTEAKQSLYEKMVLEKTGLRGALLDSIQNDQVMKNSWLAMSSGELWGDLWWDSVAREMDEIKQHLSKLYVELALQPEGRWRLNAERIALEERYQVLQKELGLGC
jgi:hypothetical protein